MEITPILPSSDAKIDFETLDCFIEGPEISIVDDSELMVNLSVSVIELLGNNSKITFYPDCSRPYLVLHIKNLQRFFSITILCSDDTGKDKILEISNKNTIITVNNNQCKLPMEVKDGWQHICIELDELLANAYSATYALCKK